jgi:3-hydroxy-3-methylglutaryl CoA synthase
MNGVHCEVSVGIDDIDLYASTQSIEFGALAAARGFTEKDLRSIRFHRRSVLPSFEDPVTLAVNAAGGIVEDAGRDAFGLLIVATESGLDFGKSLSSYVHRYLGLCARCRNFEIKHACFGGTAALLTAASWVREAPATRRALVVMTDVARCHFGELTELTGGSGAVALSVSAAPRVLRLDSHTGMATQEVYDVARPSPSFEWNDPVLSLYSYLDLLDLAWNDYRTAADTPTGARAFARILYHAPLTSLVERAHRALLESEDEEVSDEAVAESFARMVEPTLALNAEIGNIYSGSLYASLAGAFDAGPPLPPDARLGLFSYGSGACAEFFSGRVSAEAAEVVARRRIRQRLAARRVLDVPGYESAMRALESSMSAENVSPDPHASPELWESAYEGRRLLVLEGARHYHRSYRWS